MMQYYNEGSLWKLRESLRFKDKERVKELDIEKQAIEKSHICIRYAVRYTDLVYDSDGHVRERMPPFTSTNYRNTQTGQRYLVSWESTEELPTCVRMLPQ